jgi:Tol biopolymer transport system component
MPIGAGGMGEVYRATDTKLGRDVAVKVLPESFAQDADRMARFTREARVLAALNHPHIAQIYAVEDRALVMELVEGEPLLCPQPLEIALEYARQIADALETAHEKGITHRDLKPANIMVTPQGVVKVLDFGLAAVAQSSGADPSTSPTLTISPTQAGMILGTAAYMAPEQARGKVVDKRADIWAFGVVLYEMLTGEQLFQGETVSDTLASVLTKDPDLTRVPVKVRRLLQGCLEKDLKSRLRDIGDVWRLLEETPLTPARAAKLPWAIAGAAIVLAGANAVWSWLHRAPTSAAQAYSLEIVPPDGESLYQDARSGLEAISPDGRTLAFIAESKGTRHIWLRPLDSPAARPLQGTELASGLFWSPDSRHLGFMTGYKLEHVEIATGAIKEICDAGGAISGASWNSSGTIVFAGPGRPVRRVSADGGIPIPVTAIDRQRESSHHMPQFLPDGKHFLYWVQGIRAVRGVYIGSLDVAPEKQRHTLILASPRAALYAELPGHSGGHVLFIRGTTLFAQSFDPNQLGLSGEPRVIAENVGGRGALAQFSASQTGLLAFSSAGNLNRSVTIVSRDGTTVETLGKPNAFDSERLSPDGRTLAVALRNEDSIDIWLMDLVRGVPTRFTDDSALDLWQTWSPDGKELLFGSTRAGPSRMYRKPLAGNGTERLVQPTESSQYPVDWSRDGKAILYLERLDERSSMSLRLLPLGSGISPIPVATPVLQSRTSLSPSGDWVAFSSSESGTPEIYVQPIPGRGGTAVPKVRVSSTGGVNPAWSADGGELFFNSLDDRLMSVAVKYSGDRFEAAEPKQLFPLGGSSYFNGAIYWEPIGNGQQFVVLRTAPVSGRDNRINVIINWDRGVRQ